MARYLKLRRGGDHFVWDSEKEQTFMRAQGTSSYVKIWPSLVLLHKQGWLEDLGSQDSLPSQDD